MHVWFYNKGTDIVTGFILNAACATVGYYTAHCMCHCMALYWVRYVLLYGK